MSTAKEIQTEFIQTYLKPKLKEYRYKTNAQTWWKNMGDYFIVINLQNSQWNSKEELSFCLNIGVAITEKIADKEKKRVTYFDMAVDDREDAFLPETRLKNESLHKGGLGYKITDTTNMKEFIEYFKIDFEEHILKTLEKLRTLNDCIVFYEKAGLGSAGRLKRQIEECGLKIS